MSGDYADLEGANVIVLARVVGQRPGESPLELFNRNTNVFQWFMT